MTYDLLKSKRETIKAEIDRINQAVEEKVLDSELFLRESKQYMLLPENKGTAKQHKFNDVLSRNFEDGKAMEIIDGDID